MATVVTKPQGRIKIGTAMVGGQVAPVTIDIEWDRYLDTLTRALNAGLAGFVGAQGSAGAAIAMLSDDGGGDIEFIPGPPGPAADIDLATTITATTVVTARSGTILVDTTAGDVTVTLPANGLTYRIKRITAGANTLTVATAAGDIDGAATATIAAQYESITLKSDGTDYWIV